MKTPFATLNRAFQSLLSGRSSVLIMASQSICNVHSTSNAGVYSKVTATRKERIERMQWCLDILSSTNLSINYVPTGNGTSRLSTAQNIQPF